MKLTIDIQEHKLDFFLELLNSFEDFITVEPAKDTLSPAHKALLDERLTQYKQNPNDLIDWEDLRTELEQQA